MAVYLYVCEVNDIEFETEHSIKIELEECEICKGKNLEQHKPKRLIAGSTLGKVNLTGHELNQKLKDDTQKLKRDVYSNEKHYANVLGNDKYQSLQTAMDRNKRR